MHKKEDQFPVLCWSMDWWILRAPHVSCLNPCQGGLTQETFIIIEEVNLDVQNLEEGETFWIRQIKLYPTGQGSYSQWISFKYMNTNNNNNFTTSRYLRYLDGYREGSQKYIFAWFASRIDDGRNYLSFIPQL